MRTLFSIYVWLAWVLLLLTWGPVAIVATLISRELGFRVVRAGSRFAFALAGIRMQVLGAERVDWSRAHVLMGNHQGYLDPFVLVNSIPRHAVGIEKKENFLIPVYGQLAKAWGNLPIDRANPGAAHRTIEEAEARLQEGVSIAIFPEGTRTLTGQMGPFKKGGFHLAINTGAEIVPFTLNGCFERFTPGDWRIRPGLVTLEWSEPISTAGYTKETMDALIERVRAAIAAHYEGVEAEPAPAGMMP